MSIPLITQAESLLNSQASERPQKSGCFASKLFKSTVSTDHPTHHETSSSSFLRHIGRIASIALMALASMALYWINPSLFAFGFFAGVLFQDQAKEAINKIENVWRSQPWTGTLLIAFAGMLSLPVTLASSALLIGARLGSTFASTSRMEGVEVGA